MNQGCRWFVFVPSAEAETAMTTAASVPLRRICFADFIGVFGWLLLSISSGISAILPCRLRDAYRTLGQWNFRRHHYGQSVLRCRSGTQRQANFAHDLRPQVQRRRGVFPLCERQSRPGTGRAVHDVGKRVGRLALLSPVLGETDAPAPVRAKEWAKGEGESEGLRAVQHLPKPLTSRLRCATARQAILSPPAMREATEARALSVSISNYT